MIFDELHTAFRWYSDLGKQNRYRGHCEISCSFKLLNSPTDILPFQIKTGLTGATLSGWDIYCADDNTFYDYVDSSGTGTFGALHIQTVNGEQYIYYGGPSFDAPGSGVVNMNLPCGYYYSVVTTSLGTYYSEIFYVDDSLVIPAFTQMTFPHNTPWRFYDNINKQNRYKSACAATCNFYLISGNDALLPFQFRRPIGSPAIASWVLRSIDEDCEHVIDINLYLEQTIIGAYEYISYYGAPIPDLPCGKFYAILTDGVNTYYSELIEIVNTLDSITVTDFLLQENGDYILQENSSKIALE